MKISIGADHRGFELKSYIISNFKEIDWIDVGTGSEDRTDYPIYSDILCEKILSGESYLGVLICGSGVGMSIAANRNKKIYAALCWDEKVAVKAKEDDSANVLVLPSDFVSKEKAFLILKSWLNAKFKGGRYKKRIEMLDK